MGNRFGLSGLNEGASVRFRIDRGESAERLEISMQAVTAARKGTEGTFASAGHVINKDVRLGRKSLREISEAVFQFRRF